MPVPVPISSTKKSLNESCQVPAQNTAPVAARSSSAPVMVGAGPSSMPLQGCPRTEWMSVVTGPS